MKSKILFSVLISLSTLFVACKEQNQNAEAQKDKKETSKTSETTAEKEAAIQQNLDGKIDAEGPKYICFTRNDNEAKRIWIEFNKDNIAQMIKYEGQDQTIELRHIEEKYHEGGAHPSIVNEYDEMDQGKVTGHYTHIHSGIWDYVTYTHGKETFKYTIDHDEDPYGSKPCF